MTPTWKIKRELKRLKVQASAIPLAIYEPFLQRRYDPKRPKLIKYIYGAVPAKDNLVIFLIYQPHGLPASILDTCIHLVTSGFAPIIVSNMPLSDTDRIALTGLAHIVAERPNFGYDFGGYRDGLWLINQIELKPKSILFLNDSIWFPAREKQSLLTELLQPDLEYTGVQIFDHGSKGNIRRSMFGSYCFAVNERLLKNSEFIDFWENYRLSSNKELTLRRGERAFSIRMMKETTQSKGIYSLHRFNSVIEGLKSDKLREALGDMIAIDSHLEGTRLQLLNQKTTINWVNEAKTLLQIGAKTKNYIGSSPIVSIREMGFPMIKKNNERLYKLARARILLAVDEGRLNHLNCSVLRELRKKVKFDKP
tara:strand:- start:827 stop:1924 length:1098 start_codon:yes stop_codon:yes gene_type:complete